MASQDNDELFPDLTTTCAICGRRIGAYGRYNHSMSHVRKGEATVQNHSLTSLKYGFRFPYVFKLVKQNEKK